jgi:hypothetical protein
MPARVELDGRLLVGEKEEDGEERWAVAERAVGRREEGRWPEMDMWGVEREKRCEWKM